jgi:hypothetical protein
MDAISICHNLQLLIKQHTKMLKTKQSDFLGWFPILKEINNSVNNCCLLKSDTLSLVDHCCFKRTCCLYLLGRRARQAWKEVLWIQDWTRALSEPEFHKNSTDNTEFDFKTCMYKNIHLQKCSEKTGSAVECFHLCTKIGGIYEHTIHLVVDLQPTSILTDRL